MPDTRHLPTCFFEAGKAVTAWVFGYCPISVGVETFARSHTWPAPRQSGSGFSYCPPDFCPDSHTWLPQIGAPVDVLVEGTTDPEEEQDHRARLMIDYVIGAAGCVFAERYRARKRLPPLRYIPYDLASYHRDQRITFNALAGGMPDGALAAMLRHLETSVPAWVAVCEVAGRPHEVGACSGADVEAACSVAFAGERSLHQGLEVHLPPGSTIYLAHLN